MTEEVRLLRLQQVLDLTGLRRSTLYQLVAVGDAPPPIQITTRTVGWVHHEIQDFIRRRIAATRVNGAMRASTDERGSP